MYAPVMVASREIQMAIRRWRDREKAKMTEMRSRLGMMMMSDHRAKEAKLGLESEARWEKAITQ